MPAAERPADQPTAPERQPGDAGAPPAPDAPPGPEPEGGAEAAAASPAADASPGETEAPQGEAEPPGETEAPQGGAEAAPQGWLARVRAWARRRSKQTEARWSLMFARARRRGVVAKVLLLHFRYTCGYLAAGFLISAPIQLGTQQTLFNDPGSILKSLALGLIFGAPFVILHPFTQIDWGRMRLPEFKNLELALTRYATYAALALFLGSLLVRLVPPWRDSAWVQLLFDVRVTWLALVLMFFAWVRVKSHTVIFKDFYTLKPGDDLVLSYPPPVEGRAPPAAPAEAGAPAAGTAETGEARAETGEATAETGEATQEPDGPADGTSEATDDADRPEDER